jgi:hypothetical protein
MSRTHDGVSSMLTTVALFLPVVFSGLACVDDPDYEGYYVWDNSEGAYYQRWEARTYLGAGHLISRLKQEAQ